jgi:FixJ family two-component response regulator
MSEERPPTVLMEGGAVDYLTKPARRADILAAVHKVMARRGAPAAKPREHPGDKPAMRQSDRLQEDRSISRR